MVFKNLQATKFEQRLDIPSFLRGIVILLVLVAGLILTNCAGTPDVNPIVQEAEHAYQQIEDDSLVVKYASAELKKAKEAVREVKKSIERSDNQAIIEQKVLLAQQRVKIARKTAELRAARDEVQRTSNKLQTLLNNAPQADQNGINAQQEEIEVEERLKHLTNFETKQTNRGLVIRFESGNFELGKAYLKSNAAGAINELADFLDDYPERSVLIEGHTDNTGSESFNKKLSQQRATAVRQALIARNMDAKRIRAIGFGEQYPRVSNDTEAGRQYNRRVEIILSDSSGTIPARQ